MELVNERIMLNNSNPVVSLFLLLIVYGVLNYIFRCDMQTRRIQEQQMHLRQQELYIQNLESVQRDVRIFRHDFKTGWRERLFRRMRGIFRQSRNLSRR